MKKFILICEIILLLMFMVLVPFLSDKLVSFFVIPLFLFLNYFAKKIPDKHFVIFLFGIAFLIRIISIMVLKVEIVDDFLTMLKASRLLINGDLSFLKMNYFINFSYQIGHVLYQSLLLKIINSVLFLKIINSIITSSSIIFLYLIGKKLFKIETAKKISLLYLFYFYPIYLNSVLTNQLLSTLLCLFVIYYYLSKKISWKHMIVIAVILGCANFLRTESIIWIVSICFYHLFVAEGKVWLRIKQVVLLLGCYFLFNTLISSVFYISPLHTRLDNKYPDWKFYCGLSVEHNGFYNAIDDNNYFSSNHKEKLLSQRIHNDYKKFPVLFLKKEVILWTQTNYDLRLEQTFPYYFYLFNQGFLNIIIILFVIGLIPFKDNKNSMLLLKLLLGVYYFVYLLIEISPRYAYNLHFLVFLMVGYGIERLFNWFYRFKK